MLVTFSDFPSSLTNRFSAGEGRVRRPGLPERGAVRDEGGDRRAAREGGSSCSLLPISARVSAVKHEILLALASLALVAASSTAATHENSSPTRGAPGRAVDDCRSTTPHATGAGREAVENAVDAGVKRSDCYEWLLGARGRSETKDSKQAGLSLLRWCDRMGIQATGVT